MWVGIDRLSIEEAKSYWFNNDLVIYAFGGQDYDEVIALPKVEVERGLKYLRKLKNCKTYGQAQELYIEFSQDPDAPKLIPKIQDIKNDPDSLFELWCELNPDAYDEDSGLFLEEEPTNDEMFESIKDQEFIWDQAPVYLDDNGMFAACRNMQIWTDAWIPREIAEKVGTPDKGYGIDYYEAELIYKDRDLFIEEFLSCGIRTIMDSLDLRELGFPYDD
jgi:hypothetical protein